LCRDQLGFYGLHSNQAGEADMIRIIIADDHSIVRLGLTKILAEMANVQVVAEAPSGEVAVQLARRLQPDIVLMDIMMPEMNGHEAINLIRKNKKERISTLPIIALTAKAMQADRSDALMAGANSYVTKPINAKLLIMTMISG